MKKGALINCTNSQENTCARASFLINSQAWGLQLYLKKTLAHAFSCEFCEISKNILFIEHLWMTASDFICGVFFIFSIIKNFRHEKRRFVRKKSTSGKPAKSLYYKEIIIKLFYFHCSGKKVVEKSNNENLKVIKNTNKSGNLESIWKDYWLMWT